MTYAAEVWADDLRHSMNAFGVNAEITEIDADIGFSYFHPLSNAELTGAPELKYAPLQAQGEVVLRFGFVEGDVVVHADRAVYDPQNANDVLKFRENGSRADLLAIVLNENELAHSVGGKLGDAVSILTSLTAASAIVVKRGPAGAAVFANGQRFDVPAYRTKRVFKIGSGDVFSAVFAFHWGEKLLPAAEAAELASQAAARYVETKDVIGGAELKFEPASTALENRQIYIAAPFFNLGQRWVVEEARRCLLDLGARVFSPIHNVGSIGSARHIAKADLEGLDQSACMLAILDGEDAGTLFEVGYARKLGIPVIALAGSLRPESLTMVEGTDCLITDDFATAIYQTIWAAAQ